jgi:hypothetical protein
MSTGVWKRVSVAAACIFLTIFVGGFTSAQDQSGPRELLEKAMKAMGGEEKLTKFKAASWKFRGKGYGPEGVATTVGECFRHGADQYRCDAEWEFEGKRVKFTEVINRNDGWVRNTAGTFAIGEEEEFSEIKTQQLYLRWLTTLVPLKDKLFTLSSGGELKVGDRMTSCLLVSREGYRDVLLCFDKESCLLIRSEMPVKVQRGSDAEIGKLLIQETYFSDYKEAETVRYASKMTTKIDGKLRSEVEITEFKPHEMLSEIHFAKP